MPTKDAPVLIDDCRGGQNAAQPPHAVAANQVAAAVNVEWYRATVARKRRGSRLVERDAGSVLPTNRAFTTLAGVQQPGNILTANPIGVVIETSDPTWFQWGYDAPVYDFQGASAADTPTTNACLAYFNGQWWAAYKSGVNRLHYLGVGSGPASYRAGLAAPALPGIVKSGGAVTDNRKYRAVVYYNVTGGPRSEPSAELGPEALAAQQATISDPGSAPSGELYNRWELQAASDDDNYATWWVVGNAAATTDIVDNNASLFGLEPAHQLGLFEPPISVKYLQADDNRLLMAGAYENTIDAKLQSRVWFTPVLGDMDIGDDQRIPDTTTQSNWVDIDAGDAGGDITGFGPSTLGDVLVFKRAQLWRLGRTGNLDAPYLPRPISKAVGTFGYRTVQTGEDAQGNPCVYFAGARGPYRVGGGGVEYLGAAIEDIWLRVNQFGNVHLSQHAVYYPDKGQYWLWVSVDGATVPGVLLVLTVATGGWAAYTGPLATALCSALLPRFMNEANKGITPANATTARWVPYCCPNTNGQIVECDAINPSTGVALDTDLETWTSGSTWADGTTYQAYIETTPLPPKTLDGYMTVQDVSVEADAAAGVTLSVSLIRDHGAETRTFTTSLAAAGTETRVLRRVEGAATANAKAVAVRIGDGSAVASQWNVLRAQLRVQTEAAP